MSLIPPTIEAYQVQHLPIVKAYADKRRGAEPRGAPLRRAAHWAGWWGAKGLLYTALSMGQTLGKILSHIWPMSCGC